MPDFSPTDTEFIRQVTAAIEKNMANEQFGVSELADEMNMSRSNLLRKVKKLTKLSVSQLISQVRLKRGMELLRTSLFNVSEISHQVGFSSTSYFIKCFREYYGYPPGEVGKRSEEELNSIPDNLPTQIFVDTNRKRKFVILGSIVLLAALAAGWFGYTEWSLSQSSAIEKSIAVLPFKNDSNDSSNLYLINGLMESTLNNLQQMKDLRVISRTSSEKYRNTTKSIPEMGKELNVKYFVEGSGQKIGDHIVLNIQLIEASSDKHLWAKQYRRETKDIFVLQQEIAKNIADEIEVIITPEVKEQIEKIPTDNLVAYDFYLKGKDLFYQSTGESLKASVPYFKNAIELDDKFALAYANATMVLYYLDIFQTEKKYTADINAYANKAMALEPKSTECLIAKALSYAHIKEYEQAVPYLEQALDYDPKAGLAVHFLTEFYSIYVSNPSKYIVYALKGVKLIELPAYDSAMIGFKYFHLSNALMQAGFVDDAIKYMDISLAYDPHSYFAGYVSILFRYARNKDIKLTREQLTKKLDKDTTRIDIVKEVARICYTMRDYKTAYRYYRKFASLREAYHMEIFKEDFISLGIVFSKVGQHEKAEEYIKNFKDFADQDRTRYKQVHLSLYYAYHNDTEKAIEHLTLFSKEDNFVYWILLLDNDPAVDNIKDLPQFKKIMHDIETKFWNKNKEIKAMLDEEGLP
ncbi:MAG: helix-turn-helix domain-containing protein [Chryseolinea sp.]